MEGIKGELVLAKLQATIDDEVYEILKSLSRRNDRARFIEVAIKQAIKMPEVYNQFSWSHAVSSVNKNKMNNKKIIYDDDF